jgi:hypothetical protein
MGNRSLSQSLTTPLPADRVGQHRRGIPAFLTGRKGLLLAAAALGIVALLVGWAWLGTAAVLPLLYTLPCAAMMAMCMRGNGRAGNGAADKPKTGDGSEPGGSA